MLAVAAIAAACGTGPESTQRPRLTQDEVDACRTRLWDLFADTSARREALVHERSLSEQPAWAGSYKSPVRYDNHWLEISGERFIYELYSCCGSEVLVRGSVASKDGSLLVFDADFCIDTLDAPEVQAGKRRPFRWEREMYSVPWGDQRFLVPKSLMPEFCARVHDADWQGRFYVDHPRRLQSESEDRHDRPNLTGLPDVPPEFRRYLPE